MRNKNLGIILIIVLLLIFVDFSNLDRFLYSNFCDLSSFVFSVNCTDFYDIPIWEASVTFGTIAAAYFAYAGIAESNKRMEIEQSPHLVFVNNIGLSNSEKNGQKLHIINVKNIGKGRALNISLTADDKLKLSIIEGSNSGTIDLKEGDHNYGWALDEEQVIKGLKIMNIHVKTSVFIEIPDENILNHNEKEKSDFYLYLWYEDQIGTKYKTVGKFRHSGFFLKHMESKVIKL